MNRDHIPIVLISQASKRKYPAEVLVVATRDRYVVRNNQHLKMEAASRKVLIALTANAGSWISKQDLVDVCYGDDPHGGPDLAENRISQAIIDCRMAGAALGIIVSTKFNMAMVRPWRPTLDAVSGS